MITVLSSNEKGKEIFRELQRRNILCQYVDVLEINILPCFSCGGCLYKTYNRCILNDDTNAFIEMLDTSDTWIIVDTIAFGSYSFKMKRAIDKLALLSDRKYYIKNKEMTKGNPKSKQKNYYVLGTKESFLTKEKETFLQLIHETALLTGFNSKVVVGNKNIDIQFALQEFMI